MTARPQQPEPFVRGWAFPPTGSVAYPRLHPQEADQLPGDVWSAASLPVGVRLELVGDASAVRLRYRTDTANLGYRGDGAGCSFVAFRSGRRIAEVPAVLGEGEVVLPLPGDSDQPVTVYLPEGMRPVVSQIQPADGSLRPAPRQPRCLVYGDAVTQGWLASSPVGSWPALVGRMLGLDICNLGCSGTTRLEPAVAQMIARTPAEAVVVAVGTGCWSRPPHSVDMLVAELVAFLQLVRAGHPDVPLLVMSPTCRPAAEDTPNVFGATLADLRRAAEDTVAELAIADERLMLLDGLGILGPDDLEDGTYPGDDGHKRIAGAVRKVLAARADSLKQAAVARWQEEVLASSPAFAGMAQPARRSPPRPPATQPTTQRRAPAVAVTGGEPAGTGTATAAQVPAAVAAAARATAAAAEAFAAASGGAVPAAAGGELAGGGTTGHVAAGGRGSAGDAPVGDLAATGGAAGGRALAAEPADGAAAGTRSSVG